jgi:MFS transporter, OCT family, solute carrier family 22 (organic cation transporter), member 4/5
MQHVFHDDSTCCFHLTLSQALAGLVEIPAIGIAMYIIMKTGKKWLFSFCFMACGVSCLLAAFCEDKSMLWLKITFVMIGKMS